MKIPVALFTLIFAGCVFDVEKQKPPEPPLSYSTPSAFYALGAPISGNSPDFILAGSGHYSVTPPLPSGLSLDTVTGEISGTPAGESAVATYTVTATRDTISVTASLRITISHWIGFPLDSIQNAIQLLVRGNEIFVANRSSTDPAMLVVDNSSGKITAYYSELLPPAGMALTQDSHLVVTETNYAQGAISILDLSAKFMQKSVLSFGSDNSVSAANGKVFLFDRTTGVITGFSGHVPNRNIALNVQTGANSNPYDIAISNNLAFIPRYNLASLLILDAGQLGGGTRDSIDLSRFNSHSPSDTVASVPRMAWATAYNGYVFVAMQRLNYNYSALDTSVVAVIDAATKQIVSTIPLLYKNPIAAHAVNGVWYLVSIAGYGDQSGGVEKIDLATRQHAGSIITEQSLGADVFDFASINATEGYVAYSSDYGYTTQVKKVSF